MKQQYDDQNINFEADQRYPRPTYALLDELEGSLIFVDAEELDSALLVGGKSDDLGDDVANESSALGGSLTKTSE